MIEDCDLTGNGSGVFISPGADLSVRHCRVRDNDAFGVGVEGNGRGIIVDCDIAGNGDGLIGVDPAAKYAKDDCLKVRACRIYDNKETGISFGSNGRAMIEDCDIHGNSLGGVTIQTGADPTLRRCRIHDDKQHGVYIYDNGRGMIEDCDIHDNAFSGVAVRAGGDPTMRGCRINNNQHSAIYIRDGGSGTFEDNDLTGNRTGAWDMDRSSKKKVRSVRNRE